MAIGNTNPNAKDVVILQRDDTNSQYNETHISGSNLIIYIDSTGHINADDSASFYSIYPPSTTGGSGTTLITGSTYPFTSSWSTSSVFSITASFASRSFSATSASWSSQSLLSTSASYASSSTTSSYVSTASWAINVVSSSYASTASWAINVVNGGSSTLQTASTYPFTASWSNNATNAIGAGGININTTDIDADYFPTMVATTAGNATLWVDNNNALKYNPSSSILTAPHLKGTASIALSASIMDVGSPNSQFTFPFVEGNGIQNLKVAGGGTSIFWYNPATTTFSVPTIQSTLVGTASWAVNVVNGGTSAVGRSMVLCAGFTPLVSGPDIAEIPFPYAPDGFTPVTWALNRLIFRVGVAASDTSSVNIEVSNGDAGFTANTIIGTMYVTSGSYTGYVIVPGATAHSGDMCRFNIVTLGTQQNWSIIAEIGSV